MKKKLLSVCVSLLSGIIMAQSIPNGGFEDWTNTSFDAPDFWFCSNYEGDPAWQQTTFKSTSVQQGTYAVQLVSVINQNFQQFGFVANGDPGQPEGQGVPYSQKPTTFNGYWKGDIKTGDSAIFWIIFKKAGSVISNDIFKVTGTQTSYQSFSFPLNLPVTPDSVIIAAASSDPFINGAAKDGSTFYVDNISFGGAGITQPIPGGDFEVWTAVSVDSPNGWENKNFDYANSGGTIPAEKVTDKYKGNYAIKLTTIYDGSGSNGNSVNGITSGKNGSSSTIGGYPYSKQVDTLIGWYKYIPSGIDTASIMMEFKKSGSTLSGQMKYLTAQTSYTYFEVPFSVNQTPDTLIVYINSSGWPVSPSDNGSALTIDEVQLKSQLLSTQTGAVNKWQRGFLFPNPASHFVNIDYTLESSSDIYLQVTDITGKLLNETRYNGQAAANRIMLDISQYPKGVYFYSLKGEGFSTSDKFVVE